MKLKIEADEKYPVFDLSEPTGNEMWPWDAVELSDKEWQDYLVVSEAYDKWQERLYNIKHEVIVPEPPDAKPQYLGNGRVWDGRSQAEDEIEEASTPRKRDIVDRMAAKRDSWGRQRDIDAEGQRAAITQMITRLALTEDEVEKASKAAKREEGEKYDDGA
jgi:hypothetical protein